jgi:AcrR family transcriptional regulator
LLQTGARLFSQYGYNGTSMEQIAEAMRLKKGSLYYHLTSKEELAFDIFTTAMNKALLGIDRILVDPNLKTAEGRLTAAVTDLIEPLGQDVDFSFSFSVLSDGQILSRKKRNRFFSLRDEYNQKFESIIANGVDSGEFTPCDTAVVAKGLLGMCSWMAMWYRPGGRLSPAQVSNIFLQVVLHGLLRDHDSRSGVTK